MLKKSGFALAVLLLSAFTIAARGFAQGASTPDGTPPDVSGDWNGTTTDLNKGTGAIELIITQTGGKLSGTWHAFWFVGFQSLKGKVNTKGIVHLTLALEDKCKIVATATMPNANEIVAPKYKYAGSCNKDLKKNDSGSIDVSR